MLVLCQNGLYELNMPLLLFQSLKKTKPHTVVTLLEFTTSSYKRSLDVEIDECEDYSITRNREALKN